MRHFSSDFRGQLAGQIDPELPKRGPAAEHCASAAYDIPSQCGFGVECGLRLLGEIGGGNTVRQVIAGNQRVDSPAHFIERPRCRCIGRLRDACHHRACHSPVEHRRRNDALAINFIALGAGVKCAPRQHRIHVWKLDIIGFGVGFDRSRRHARFQHGRKFLIDLAADNFGFCAAGRGDEIVGWRVTGNSGFVTLGLLARFLAKLDQRVVKAVFKRPQLFFNGRVIVGCAGFVRSDEPGRVLVRLRPHAGNLKRRRANVAEPRARRVKLAVGPGRQIIAQRCQPGRCAWTLCVKFAHPVDLLL